MDIIWGILVLLTVVTLVGHGIWVVMRGIIRLLSGAVPPAHPEMREGLLCPRCETAGPRDSLKSGCPVCNWPLAQGTLLSPRQRERAIALVLRRIERLHQLGLVPDRLRERIEQAVWEEVPALRPVAEPERPVAAPILRSETPAPVASLRRSEATPGPSPRTDVAARAAAYQEARQPRPDLSVGPEPVASSPVERSQPFLGLVSGFFEEKNIRWGELVGGLLIVGCSLALVISFWSSIAERPWLKFGLFNGVTALLFTLGLHAEKRWKLPNTALGLLLIASLLTPLTFLAVAAMGQGSVVGILSITGEAIAVGLLGVLTYWAGRSLVGRAPASLAAGVMVPSIAMLLVPRVVGPAMGSIPLLVLGSIPLLALGGPVGGLMLRTRNEPDAGEPLGYELVRLLGACAFSAVLSLGLLISRAGPIADVFQRLSPLAPLAGSVFLAPGLWLWRRLNGPEMAGLRTAGASIAAGGTLVLLAGIALAWPDPWAMLPVALLDFVILTLLAVFLGIPSAHALAGGCLALAYLLGWSLMTGRLDSGSVSSKVVGTLISGQSGAALVPLVVSFLAATVWVSRLGRRLDAQALGLVAGLAGLLSLGLVSWFGFGKPGDPVGASWVYGLYAALAFSAAGWFGRLPLTADSAGPDEARVLGWLGSGLVLSSLIQGLAYLRPGSVDLPWTTALLAHSSASLASWTVLRLARLRDRPGSQALREVLKQSALASSIVASTVLVLSVPQVASGDIAVRLLWLSVVWLAFAWTKASPVAYSASQAALTGSVVFFITSVLERQGWYAASAHRWVDPRTLQAQGMAIGGLCLLWVGVRLAARSRTRSMAWVDPPWPAFDRYARGAVLLVLMALSIYGVVPGVAQELAPRALALRLAGMEATDLSRVVPLASAFELGSIPHQPALGWGSWGVLAVSVMVLLAGQWERFRRVDLLGSLVALSMAALLAAGRWEADVAAASALRWTSAVMLLAVSALIWSRKRLVRWAVRAGWRIEPERDNGTVLETASALGLAMLPMLAMALFVGISALSDRPPTPDLVTPWIGTGILFMVLSTLGVVVPRVSEHRWAGSAGSVVMVLGALPLVAETAFAVASALQGNPLVGPEPRSFFGRIGLAGSYVPPILLVAATLVGYAIRERSSAFAFAAALVMNGALTVGDLLAGAPGGRTLDLRLATHLAQLNAIVSALSVLAWLASVRIWSWRGGRETRLPTDGRLTTLLSMSVLLNLIVFLVGTGAIWWNPWPSPALDAIAGPWGWAAVGLSALASAAWMRASGATVSFRMIGFALLVLADFGALGLAPSDPGDWRTYHAVLVGEALAGASLLVLAWHRFGLRLSNVPDEVRGTVVRWAALALSVVVLFSIRAVEFDPQSPWWTIGGLVSMAVLAANLSAWANKGGFLALASVLLNLAASCWWLLESPWSGVGRSSAPLADLVNLNVLVLALPVPLWMWVERRWVPRAGISRLLARWALGVSALMVIVGLAEDANGGTLRPLIGLGWLALAAEAVALGTALWDARARGAVAGLYVLVIVGSGWAVHEFHLPARSLVWTGSMVLSADSVALAYLWSRRQALRAFGDRLSIPRPDTEDPLAGLSWMVPMTVSLAAVVLSLSFGTILTDSDLAVRSSVSQAALAQAVAVGLLARGERRSGLQRLALGVGVLGAVASGWAGIRPESSTQLLDRLVVVLSVLAGASALYGLGLVKLFRRETEWTRAARRLVPALVGGAVTALVVVLGVEVVWRTGGRVVPISPGSLVAVGVALAGSAVSAIVVAVVPGRDPLGLPERKRTLYVYGAEALLALALLHAWLTLPWLFSSRLVAYWPLIILGVAFLGVGLSEVFRRQGRLVLAEPLERTGALLPVLPLLSALWTGSRPEEGVTFLILVGGLYTVLSVLRSSMGFAALAVLAFHGALWTVLGRTHGLGLAEHPQLWVVPPAVCVLIGASLNRDRLSKSQMASIRYACALAIYLASTADIVLAGVSRAPWLPLVLAGLALAGIFAGILLRVRGFLFLGVGFLSLALFTMIWYAAVDLRQTWIWAASGIVAGLLILAVFALFEKRRDEILGVVDQLKGWEP